MTRTLRPLFGLLVVAAFVAACASGGAATAPPAASDAPSAAPTEAPGLESGVPSGSPDAGNGQEPGVGIVDSELVEPQPGQQNVLSIPIEKLEATADGRAVTLMIRWSSGVAPCSVLDQVLLKLGDESVDVTIREGTSDPNAMCVMMLRAKHTIVSFELEPGTYTIRDTEGGAPPIELTVS
jgi:hypothetical protein